jgi:hypothetical protein
MIKFFRKIRHQLLTSPPEGRGRAGKYLLYAIGEIVLVVIGILIALRINNWNEENNEKKTEQNYLLNILEDLNNDIEIYQNFERKNQIIYNLIDSIVPNIKSPDRRNKVDDLAYWTRNVTMEWQVIHPVERTFEQMKSSGHLRLIRDKDVANSISNYYNSIKTFDGYNEAGFLWAAEYVKSMGKIFDAELLRNIMLKRTKQVASPEDILTNDPVVINELINSLQYFNGALSLGEEVSKKAKFNAKNLIQLINQTYGLK